MSRFKLLSILGIPAVALMAFGLWAPGVAATAPSADHAAVLETKMALRDLWVEHVFWIRSYVMAAHSHNDSQREIAEREIVANAKVLAGTITPYYGQTASDSLFKLLAGHWGAVRDYDTAIRMKAKPAQDQAVANLMSNARQIARFLNGANPNLAEGAVFGLLSSHGGHHVAQINEVASGDFASEARTWHAMRSHMLVLSDAIADGIAKQFPERFQDRP